MITGSLRGSYERSSLKFKIQDAADASCCSQKVKTYQLAPWRHMVINGANEKKRDMMIAIESQRRIHIWHQPGKTTSHVWLTLCEVSQFILLLALHCIRQISIKAWQVTVLHVPSAIPLRKCSWLSFVAPSLNATIPASTQTAFSWAPLNSSVLRANSSKFTSGDMDIFLECISRIRTRAVSFGRGNSILRSRRPERSNAGSRISIRFVAAITWSKK